MSIDDFGNCWHMASSEPYFYDQSYANAKTHPVGEQGMHVVDREFWVREPRATPIPVDEQERCVLAQEMGSGELRFAQIMWVSIFYLIAWLKRSWIIVNFGTCLEFFTPCFTSSLAYSYSSSIHSLWERKLVRDFTGSERSVSTMRSGFLCLLRYVRGEPIQKNGRSPCVAKFNEYVILKTWPHPFLKLPLICAYRRRLKERYCA